MNTIALLVAMHAIASSDPRQEPWLYDQLQAQSDVILVGRLHRTTPHNLPCKELELVPVSGETATFSVVLVIKGDITDKTLEVVHYLFRPEAGVVNGPQLIEFKDQSITVKEVKPVQSEAKYDLGVPEYLMFLRKRSDGRYEPVSGQWNAVYSFREVYWPLQLPTGRVR